MLPEEEQKTVDAKTESAANVKEEKQPERLIPFKRHTGDYAVECPLCKTAFSASVTDEPQDEPVIKPCPDCGEKYDHANLDQCPKCHRWTGR